MFSFSAITTPAGRKWSTVATLFAFACCLWIEFNDAPNKRTYRRELSLRNTPKKTGGDSSWQLVNWEYPITDDEEERFSCEMTTFKSFHSDKEAQMCVYDYKDVISDAIKKDGHWKDCNILSQMWNERQGDSSAYSPEDEYYIDVGANIGSCVMEMLLSTNAKIIAFEPHPKNLYNLKKTVSQMEKSYQDRLMLFPVGLGDAMDIATIYSASDNMGHSAIGKVMPDNRPKGQEQTFDEFKIFVERMDALLDPRKINSKLMKLDAEGYECKVLGGMGADLAKNIEVIKFEYSANWLDGQECTDFLERLNMYDYSIFKQYNKDATFSGLVSSKTGLPRILDLFAVKANSPQIEKVIG